MALPNINIDPMKYIQSIEEFNGNYKDLFTFISLMDRINPTIETYAEPSQLILGDIIKSRLKGRAREVIEINCQANSWPEIKEVLLNNFGERRTCEELFENLRCTNFRTNSIDFFNDIKQRLRDLNNKTVMVLGSSQAAFATCINNIKTALNIFKSKSPEPMRTILICRNPSTLEEAIDILSQSGYAHFNPFQSNTTTRIQSNSYQGRPLMKKNYYQSSNRNRFQNQNNNRSDFQNQNNNRSHFQNQNNNRNDFQNQNNSRNHFQIENNWDHSQNRNTNSNDSYSNRNHFQNQNNTNTYNVSDHRSNNGYNMPNYQQPPPEPMEINNNEVQNNTRVEQANFHLPASTHNFRT